MIAGTVMVFFSLLVLGWTSEIVGLFVKNDEDRVGSSPYYLFKATYGPFGLIYWFWMVELA